MSLVKLLHPTPTPQLPFSKFSCSDDRKWAGKKWTSYKCKYLIWVSFISGISDSLLEGSGRDLMGPCSTSCAQATGMTRGKVPEKWNNKWRIVLPSRECLTMYEGTAGVVTGRKMPLTSRGKVKGYCGPCSKHSSSLPLFLVEIISGQKSIVLRVRHYNLEHPSLLGLWNRWVKHRCFCTAPLLGKWRVGFRLKSLQSIVSVPWVRLVSSSNWTTTLS